MSLTDQPILAYGIALAIGLLIGAERERRKGIGPTRSAMGIRTFSTASLLGAVSLTLGGPMLLAVMALAVCSGQLFSDTAIGCFAIILIS
jgi:hypothetical protein